MELPQGRRDSHREFKNISKSNAKAQTAPQPSASRSNQSGRHGKQSRSNSRNNTTNMNNNSSSDTGNGSGGRSLNLRRASVGDPVKSAELSLPPIGRNPQQSNTPPLATVDRSPLRSPLRLHEKHSEDDDDDDEDDEMEPPRYRALQVRVLKDIVIHIHASDFV